MVGDSRTEGRASMRGWSPDICTFELTGADGEATDPDGDRGSKLTGATMALAVSWLGLEGRRPNDRSI